MYKRKNKTSGHNIRCRQNKIFFSLLLFCHGMYKYSCFYSELLFFSFFLKLCISMNGTNKNYSKLNELHIQYEPSPDLGQIRNCFGFNYPHKISWLSNCMVFPITVMLMILNFFCLSLPLPHRLRRKYLAAWLTTHHGWPGIT